MTRLRVDLAAIFVGLVFLSAAGVVTVDAMSAWDLSPAVLWPAVFLSWGIVLLLRALPTSPRPQRSVRGDPDGTDDRASQERASR